MVPAPSGLELASMACGVGFGCAPKPSQLQAAALLAKPSSSASIFVPTNILGQITSHLSLSRLHLWALALGAAHGGMKPQRRFLPLTMGLPWCCESLPNRTKDSMYEAYIQIYTYIYVYIYIYSPIMKIS